MKMSLENSYKDIDDLFTGEPSVNQKAWGLINEFYHLILTAMENRGLSRADLARELGRSRSSVTQMFNKTPNLSVKKMVEIADAVGVNLSLLNREKEQPYYVVVDMKLNYNNTLPTLQAETFNVDDKGSFPKNKISIITETCSEYRQ